jgi:3-phenylpropionate/trans-cinnamate dioxygenase ferredoxin component
MAELLKVAAESELGENEMRSVEAAGLEIALYHVCGRYYATEDICSHAYARLSEGWLDEEDCAVECPLHGSKFDLASGKPRSLPATKPVRTFNVVVADGAVFVEV